ncbi:hypothetical protein OH76DRAFT_377392 [Lentinus brumalis]|uniref:Uncharacterized protein n=1 Tax=Lentinus brumalis TaxID=2498619 RepID=A0A371CIT7_9APHY|nr:hypothetical protein OH76DRAFT_377392 [Polyporus brumalis]
MGEIASLLTDGVYAHEPKTRRPAHHQCSARSIPLVLANPSPWSILSISRVTEASLRTRPPLGRRGSTSYSLHRLVQPRRQIHSSVRAKISSRTGCRSAERECSGHVPGVDRLPLLLLLLQGHSLGQRELAGAGRDAATSSGSERRGSAGKTVLRRRAGTCRVCSATVLISKS